MLRHGFFTPNSPILLADKSDSARTDVTESQASMMNIAEEVAQIAPAGIIYITSFGSALSDWFVAPGINRISGSLDDIGIKNHIRTFDVPKTLREEILNRSLYYDLPLLTIGQDRKTHFELDFSTLVPHSYIESAHKTDLPILPVHTSQLSLADHFEMGLAIGEAVISQEDEYVLIASGDMSHRLTKSAPAGYWENAKDFEDMLEKCLADNDIEALLAIDPFDRYKAAEHGLAPLMVLLGAFSSMSVETEVRTHEAPFGVGYLTAAVKRISKSKRAERPAA